MRKLWEQVRHYQYWIILGVVLIAVLFSLFNRRSNPSAPTGTPAKTPSAVTPLSRSPAAIKQPVSDSLDTLSNHPFPAAALDVNTKTIVYHDFDNDAFKRYTLSSGAEQTIAKASVYLTKALWSPDFTTLIIQALNEVGRVGTNPFYSEARPFGSTVVGSYKLQTKRFTPLNPNIKEIAYISPQEIIYQFNDGRHNNISVAQVDGSAWKNISRPKGEVALRNAGYTALLQEVGQPKITRHGANGKVMETIDVPTDLKLAQSSWTGSGRQALYWIEEDGQIAIKQLRANKSELVATVTLNTEDLVILWDNETGEVYLANFDGLFKLNSIAKP